MQDFVKYLAQRLGIYAVPEAETLKFNTNINKVLHIYLVSNSTDYETKIFSKT